MDVKKILAEINGDLATGPAARVIYVKGKTDPPLFFGLLGVTPAVTGSFVNKNTLVKGLDGKGRVTQYVTVASANGLGSRVFGVADGDGELLATLAPKFDHPFPGPLYTWKAYCIESLFPQCPWHAAWGAEPSWKVDLAVYAPYVALCRTHLRLSEAQERIGLARRTRPNPATPLLTVAGEKARLAAAKGKIMGLDPEAVFDVEVNDFVIALGNGIVEAMALIDGKWLLADYLVRNCGGGNYDVWMRRWIAHVTACGGLPEVRDLWLRITGSAP